MRRVGPGDEKDAEIALALAKYTDGKLAGLCVTNMLALALARASDSHDPSTCPFERVQRLVVEECTRRGMKMGGGLS